MTTANYVLKSQAQLNVTIADLTDNNTGLSFLFYSIVQSNTLDFKGERAEVLKRLVGSKLFPLVPMARYKKSGQDKAVYQYSRKGSAQMALELDESGFGSIAEMLGVELNQSADYYPEFAAKVSVWLDAQDAAKKEAVKAKKEKEELKEHEESLDKARDELNEKARAASNKAKAEQLGITVEEVEARLVEIEKRQTAIQLLIELGHADLVDALQAINEEQIRVIQSEE